MQAAMSASAAIYVDPEDDMRAMGTAIHAVTMVRNMSRAKCDVG